MAYSSAQLQTLEDAIAQGVLEVKYADKTVTYRSLNEMFRIRDLMKADLGTTKVTRKKAEFNRGFYPPTPGANE